MKTLSIKLPDSLAARLESAVANGRKNRSELMREALEAYLSGNREVRADSFLAATHDLAGIVKGPRDLSTNKSYLKDFGR